MKRCIFAGMMRATAVLCGVTAAVYAQGGDVPLSEGRISAISSSATAGDSLRDDLRTPIPAGIFYGVFPKEDGPYYLEGSVTVPAGETLEFGPGCVVYVGGDYSTITVFGQIVVRGTQHEPVVFMSARRQPNPWDWDRIYCRSRNRSIFEHCVVRHSNYGIMVENGSASISNSLFERNSLYGVAVKNSDVTIAVSTFSGGHVLGLLLSAGARVSADSLLIVDNTTGIGCDDQSSLSLTRGLIADNVTGMAIARDVAVSITGCRIMRNKTGILTPEPIPRKSRVMVFDNERDEKVAERGDIDALLKEPETVQSVVLPASKTEVVSKKDFSPGFFSETMSAGPASTFIGNLTAGFNYYAPTSRPHPRQDTLIDQTIYPVGLQPEIQLFASGKRGATDVNLLMDFYSNPWLQQENTLGKNMVNLGLTYDRHTLTFGDFYESGSETSIGGRQMTGVKYTGQYGTMGGGAPRFEYRLAAGESETPKDWGSNDLNQYNVTVDSGMSIRQQITYIMAGMIRPTRNSTFSAEGIISRDQTDNPFLRAAIIDPGAPKPVQAQTGCLKGTMNLFDGAMELYGEIDLGTVDTIDDEDAEKIAWYNPQLEDAVPKIFKSFVSADVFADRYAFTLGGKGIANGYSMNASVMDIGPNFFTAGNPYLEADRRVARFDVDKQYTDFTSAASGYVFEQTRITETPTYRNTLLFRGEHALGENKPLFACNLSTKIEATEASERVTLVTADTSDNDSTAYLVFPFRKWITVAQFEEKQTLRNGMSYSASYQLTWEDDFSEHANTDYRDINDRLQHQVSGWFSIKIKRTLRNKISGRVTLKRENRDSLHSLAYKLSDQLRLTVIPRKLSFTIGAELSRKNEREFFPDAIRTGTAGWQEPLLMKFYGGELEAKWTMTPRLALVLKGRYEESYDEVESSRENYDIKTIGTFLTYLF